MYPSRPPSLGLVETRDCLKDRTGVLGPISGACPKRTLSASLPGLIPPSDRSLPIGRCTVHRGATIAARPRPFSGLRQLEPNYPVGSVRLVRCVAMLARPTGPLYGQCSRLGSGLRVVDTPDLPRRSVSRGRSSRHRAT